jgi:uncharacterized membrane protein
LAAECGAHQAGEVKGKERCFGVARAGQNHCANLSGSHDCAGRATQDRSLAEWRYVPMGTCRKLKGLTEGAARTKLGLPKS